MTPIRILFVITSLGAGGAEKSLAEMLPGLRQLGYDASVVCLHRRTEGSHDDVIAAGFPVETLRGRNPMTNLLLLRRLIVSRRPDIVHTSVYEADILGRLASWRLPVLVVTSLVNTAYAPVRLEDPAVMRWKLAVARFVDGFTARRLTHHFHALGEAVAADAATSLRIPRTKITVVPRGRSSDNLGTPTDERRTLVRRQLGLPMGQPVAINVARQEFQKGLETLFAAFDRIVLKRFPSATLLQVGRVGHSSESLRQLLSSAQSPDRIKVLGHRDDVADLLCAADVFVFPSLYEGQGGALVEAMALGLPVVASDIPALAEVVRRGQNALLVPPGEVEPLGEAICRLIEDPAAMATYGRASREIFQERFTSDEVLVAMDAMYRVILRPQSGSRRRGPGS